MTATAGFFIGIIWTIAVLLIARRLIHLDARGTRRVSEPITFHTGGTITRKTLARLEVGEDVHPLILPDRPETTPQHITPGVKRSGGCFHGLLPEDVGRLRRWWLSRRDARLHRRCS